MIPSITDKGIRRWIQYRRDSSSSSRYTTVMFLLNDLSPGTPPQNDRANRYERGGVSHPDYYIAGCYAAIFCFLFVRMAAETDRNDEPNLERSLSGCAESQPAMII